MRYGDTFTDGRVTKDSILNLVNSRRRVAEDNLMRFFSETKTWYNVYRGLNPGSISTRHDVTIPILFSQIMSDVNFKCQNIFQDNEVIQFIPNNDFEAPMARKNSALVNMQLHDADSYVKAVDFFTSAAIYGTGIARLRWHFEQKPKNYRVNILGQEQIMSSVKTKFDGPNWDVVDILDFFPEPGKLRLRDCDWVIHTYYIDLDTLLEQQSGDGIPMFAPEAIMELLDSGMGSSVRDAWRMRSTTYRTWTDYASRAHTSFSKPVRIDEYWGKVPSEFGIQGDRNLVITVANEAVVLRYESNPFWNDEIPFKIFTPMPDPHSLHGTGKAEIGAKLQANINKLANIKLDALEIFGNPAFFVSDNAGLDGKRLIMRPGANFPVQGEDVNKVVMPISPDIRALSMLYQEMGQLGMFGQQGVGIPSDVVQGLDAADRETARSVMTRKEAAVGRLQGESMLAESQFIAPLAVWMKEASSQLLSLPKEIKMMGQDAVMDPQTGMPVMPPPMTMGYGDMDGDYKCRAVGSQRMMSKSMMAQQMFTFLQTAGAVPSVLAMINWVNFTKIMAKSMGLNPADILVPQVMGQIPIPILNQIAMQGGGASPEQTANTMVGMGQQQGMEPQGEAPIARMGAGSDSL